VPSTLSQPERERLADAFLMPSRRKPGVHRGQGVTTREPSLRTRESESDDLETSNEDEPEDEDDEWDANSIFTRGIKVHFSSVRLVASACLALRAIGRTTGVVVDVGARRIEVALVRHGEVCGALELPLEHAARCLAVEQGEAEPDEVAAQLPAVPPPQPSPAETTSHSGSSGSAKKLKKPALSAASMASGVVLGGGGKAAELSDEDAAIAKHADVVCDVIQRLVAAERSSTALRGGSDDGARTALECVLLVGGNARALARSLFSALYEPAFTADEMGRGHQLDSQAALLVPRTGRDGVFAVVRGAQIAAGERVAQGIESCMGRPETAQLELPGWVERWECTSGASGAGDEA